jgi:hypothetical protein
MLIFEIHRVLLQNTNTIIQLQKYIKTMKHNASSHSITFDKEKLENLQFICNECLHVAKSYGFTKEEIINELKNQ